MAPEPSFVLGARVRISRHFFLEELRGCVGIVTRPPESLARHAGDWRGYWRLEKLRTGEEVRVYWLELDPPVPGDDPEHPADGTEVDEDDIELAD
ncbi:MAG: hypothetical protein HY721_08615 [Planctomycetes bacterium]|nr:hypothetical protein [Planctomycetota bacterium]